MDSPAVEKKTVGCMIRIFCRSRHHAAGDLCGACRDLLDYAMERVDRCPHGEKKPQCRACAVPCYRPAYRDRIREIMRFAGPRMLFRHPILALRHLLR